MDDQNWGLIVICLLLLWVWGSAFYRLLFIILELKFPTTELGGIIGNFP